MKCILFFRQLIKIIFFCLYGIENTDILLFNSTHLNYIFHFLHNTSSLTSSFILFIMACRWCSSGQYEARGPRWWWWWWRSWARRRGWFRGRSREAAWCPASAADCCGSATSSRGHEKCDGQVGGGGKARCQTCKQLNDSRLQPCLIVTRKYQLVSINFCFIKCGHRNLDNLRSADHTNGVWLLASSHVHLVLFFFPHILAKTYHTLCAQLLAELLLTIIFEQKVFSKMLFKEVYCLPSFRCKFHI